MNIGIDGFYAITGSADSEVYTRSVIAALAADHPDNRVLVYIPKVAKKRRLPLIEELPNAEYRLPAASGFKGNMWRAFGITNCLQADGVEVYHGVNGILPLNIASAHLPTVVTIHGPSHAWPTKDFTWLKRTVLLHMIGASVREATRVVVYNHTTRNELLERYDIDPSKINLLDKSADYAGSLMEVYRKAIDDYARLTAERVSLLGSKD